jgi:E3 ubiquitin-protein ligase UBR1
MCYSCFKHSSHQSHSTVFHYSGGGGGCCDCGDEEAWIQGANCSLHSPPPLKQQQQKEEKEEKEKEIYSLPQESSERMTILIVTVLEFIIEAFNDMQGLSNSHSLSHTKGPILHHALKDQKPLPPFYQAPNSTLAPLYSLILWNDESHSFNEVIDQVMEAIHVTEEEAKQVANQGLILLR